MFDELYFSHRVDGTRNDCLAYAFNYSVRHRFFTHLEQIVRLIEKERHITLEDAIAEMVLKVSLSTPSKTCMYSMASPIPSKSYTSSSSASRHRRKTRSTVSRHWIDDKVIDA
jgi:hypothetical protein